jgi:hypothetical protein
VVGVEMRQEDPVELDQPGRALHLPLGALAAVEEHPLPSAPHHDGRGRPPGGGHRPAGAEEDDVEVHGAATVAALRTCAIRTLYTGADCRSSAYRRSRGQGLSSDIERP